MKEQIQKQVSNYYKPTPIRWRYIGDSILGLGTILTGISAFQEKPYLTLGLAILTWLGKTLSNMPVKE